MENSTMSNQVTEENLIECLMCGSSVATDYLQNHIRFNHLINRETLVSKMHSMHWRKESRSLSTQTPATWVKSTGAECWKDDVRDAETDGNASDGVIDEAADEKIFCFACKDEDYGSPMIRCHKCERWFHMSCVDFDSDSETEDWVCTGCSTNPSRKQKTINNGSVSRSSSSLSRDDEFEVKVTAVVKSQRNHILEASKKTDNSEGEISSEEDMKQRKSTKRKCASQNENSCKNKRSKLDKKRSVSKDIDDRRQRTDGTELGNDVESIKGMRNREISKDVSEDHASSETQGCKNRIKNLSKKNKNKCKLVEVEDTNETCKLCGYGCDLPDELELGPLYRFGVCQAHLHCLMFSSGLVQGGEEDEGIIGFLPDDIIQEWQRGSKLRCSYCKFLYATVGCCQRLCLKTYHLPCGIKNGAVGEYYGNFDSYCPKHKHIRTIGNDYVLTDLGLVPEKVDAEAGEDTKDREKGASESKKKRSGNEKENKMCSTVPKIKSKSSQSRIANKVDDASINKPKSEIISRCKRPVIKPKQLEDYDTTGSSEDESYVRKSKRQRKRVELDSGIYKSAKEELQKMLKNKYISIEESFQSLSGKRRVESTRSSHDDSDFSEVGYRQKKSVKVKRKKLPQEKRRITQVNNDASSAISYKDEETIADIEQFIDNSENSLKSNSSMVCGRNKENLLSDRNSKKYFKKSCIMEQNDGPNDNLDLRCPRKIDKHSHTVSFDGDLTSEEEETMGIRKIIDNLAAEEVRFKRLIKYLCRKCEFYSESKTTVMNHMSSMHRRLMCGTPFALEMKLFLRNIRLKEDQLKEAKSMSINTSVECQESKTAESRTSSEPIAKISNLYTGNDGEVVPKSRARKKKKESAGFISWDEIARNGGLKRSLKQLNNEDLSQTVCERESNQNHGISEMEDYREDSMKIFSANDENCHVTDSSNNSSPKQTDESSSLRKRKAVDESRICVRTSFRTRKAECVPDDPDPVVIEQTDQASPDSYRSSSSPGLHSPGQVFHCTQCEARMILRKDIVLGHLEEHGTLLSEFVKQSSVQSGSGCWATLEAWVKEESRKSSENVFKCQNCLNIFQSEYLHKLHSYTCKKPEDSVNSFKILYSTIGDYAEKNDDSEGSKELGAYLLKFVDDRGREHTWVDEYEENGRPALYIDGKGRGQVDEPELMIAQQCQVEVPANIKHMLSPLSTCER